MIRARRRLVVAIGKGHIRGGRDRSLDFSDIIEEGNLGLLRAVDKFDCERGEKFSAYASWWVNRSIEQAIASQVSISRLPPYIAEPARAYARTVRRLTQLLGRESSHEEVAREMGIDTHRVRALYQVTQEARPPNKLRIYVRSGNTEFGDMP